MAFYQILLFRKKAYIRKIHKKYAEDRRAHAKNIICKRQEIANSSWSFSAGHILMPLTGGISGGFSVLHLRKTHIARQKLNALEKLYEEMYAKKLPEVKMGKVNFAKKCVIFLVEPFVGIWGVEYVIGDTDGKFDFEKELGEGDEPKEGEKEKKEEEKDVKEAKKSTGWLKSKKPKTVKEDAKKPEARRADTGESVEINAVVAENL